MGKRRSKVLEQQMRLKRFFQGQKRNSLKPPYLCPYCLKRQMFVRRKGPFVGVICYACKKGEILPHHPTFRDVDYYCMVVDKVTSGKNPVFTFKDLPSERLEFLQKHVSLGIIRSV